MWSDVETDQDFLNFRVMANLAGQMILDAGGKPLSIGISGGWGVGKSSMVKLIASDLEARSSKKLAFLTFNAWLYRGHDDAKAALMEEREAAAAMAADEKQDREHLLGMIETLQAESAALLTRAEAAEADGTRVQARLSKVENQLERFRAEEFWDRVMREIAELLALRGAMTPAEILPELRGVTVRGAALHKEPLTPGTLKKKMDVRVSFGRYFEPPQDGRYDRKAG